eukprot:1085186-Prymnesium_polylepis.1
MSNPGGMYSCSNHCNHEEPWRGAHDGAGVLARGSPWGGGLGLEEAEDRDAELSRAFHDADYESSLPAIFSRVACTASSATVATLVTIALISTGGFHQAKGARSPPTARASPTTPRSRARCSRSARTRA